MYEQSTTEQQMSTQPLPAPKVFQLSSKLSEELRKVVGDIEWLIFLKPDEDFVNIGVLPDSPLIRINGCNGEVELFKSQNFESDAALPVLNETQPEGECEENAENIKELLVPRAHARLIAISYTAHNSCLNIDGHRFYR